MKKFEELTKTLENNSNKMAVIFQWVKNDEITFEQFQMLITWVSEWEEQQVRYDSYD